MNQTRTFLLIAWLSVATLLFMQWNSRSQPAAGESTPVAATSNAPLSATGTLPQLKPEPAPTTASAAASAGSARRIALRNDVLSLQVDTLGGRLVAADLLAYPKDKTPGSAKVRLFDDSNLGYYQADAGLLDSQGGDRSAKAVFTVDQASSDRLSLSWTDPASGLVLRKTWTLAPHSYVVGLQREVSNPGTQAQVGYVYEELSRVQPPPPPKHSGLTDPESYSFVGAAWYSPQDKFEKRKFADFASAGPLQKDVQGGWFSMLQHHFLSAWLPDPQATRRYLLDQSLLGQTPVYRARAVSVFRLEAGEHQADSARLWVGPKLQKALDSVAPSLKLSVDYGHLTFLAQPVFDWVLSPLHALTGNWGWAIILTVVVLKLLTYPLSAAQFRSMAKMRAVQPRIEALKERYGEDRQKFQEAMLELYKKEKINPAGGCLPILLTIPIFIALYWVLLESVEMRQAPWVGWIQNLTASDPYFILPAINLGVMWLTQKLTPAPGMDPMQKKMMQFMPLVFGVMFAFFPAGLVLYWCTNGLLGLVQQQYITRRHGGTATAK